MQLANLKTKLEQAAGFVLDRLGEPSTWQGIGFVAGLCGAKWGANMDWGGAAAFGGTISAFLKTVLPDQFGGKQP